MQKLNELMFGERYIPLPPGMKRELALSGVDERQFSQMLAGNALTSFIAATIILLFAMQYSASLTPGNVLLLSLSVAGVSVFRTCRLPAASSAEATKEIDANLVFAARDLHISLRTGMPLNLAVRGVAAGGYGALSAIFERAYRNMENGDTEMAAFGKAASSTRSEYLHRLLAILSDSKSVNAAHSLEQYVEEAKRARARRLQEYEMRSELYSSILPILFVGSAAFTLVSVVAGSHFRSSLPLPFLILLNFVIMPSALVLLLAELQSANPGG